MRFFLEWAETQAAMYECGDGEAPYPSSQLDLGNPELSPNAASTLMDRLTLGEADLVEESEGEYVPLSLAGVLDKQGLTQFLFNDGSSIDFCLNCTWWQIGGEMRMVEGFEYAYDESTNAIVRKTKFRSRGDDA